MFSTLSTFRKHEFEKHGLCAVEDPQVFNQYGYFKFGIQLMQKLNLLKYVIHVVINSWLHFYKIL
uniref:Beta-lactamase n=1 Tax=Schistosoma mansoni TaxID=6183 RepID=A0A5K4FCH6_SCHMA